MLQNTKLAGATDEFSARFLPLPRLESQLMAAHTAMHSARVPSTLKFRSELVVVQDYFSSESPDGFALAAREEQRRLHLAAEHTRVAVQVDTIATVSERVKDSVLRYMGYVGKLSGRAREQSAQAEMTCKEAAEATDLASLRVEAYKRAAPSAQATPPRARVVPAFLCETGSVISSSGVTGDVPVAVVSQSLLWGECVKTASISEPHLLRTIGKPPFVSSGSIVLGEHVVARITPGASVCEVEVAAGGRGRAASSVLRVTFPSEAAGWRLVQHIRRVAHDSYLRASGAAGPAAGSVASHAPQEAAGGAGPGAGSVASHAPQEAAGGAGPAAGSVASHEPQAAAGGAGPADLVQGATDDIYKLRRDRDTAHAALKAALEAREVAVNQERQYTHSLHSAKALIQMSASCTSAAVGAGMDAFMRRIAEAEDPSSPLLAARTAALRFSQPACTVRGAVWGLHLPSADTHCRCQQIWASATRPASLHDGDLMREMQQRPDIPGFDSTVQLCAALLTWLRLRKAWENWKLEDICKQQAEIVKSRRSIQPSKALLRHPRRQDSLAQGLDPPQLAAPEHPRRHAGVVADLLDVDLD